MKKFNFSSPVPQSTFAGFSDVKGSIDFLRVLEQFQPPISVFSNPLADSGLGRTPSGLVQNPIWASPNPSCKGFEFRGEHGEGFDFFGAGGTRRRRVRIFARGFRFSREGFEYLREGDGGFEFFRGRETAPKGSNFTLRENQQKNWGKKKTSLLYRLLCQKI